MAATPPPTPAPKPRRWPRRLAIFVAAVGLVLGASWWYLGREATLQYIAQRVADASGGKLALSGVSGSLYGHMHIKRLVLRTPDQVLTLDEIDIDWSPLQAIAKRGLAINRLTAAGLRSETLRETPPAPMPQTLAPPFTVSIDDARLARAVFVSKGTANEIDNIRLRLHGDKSKWELRDAAAATPWGQVAASGSIGAARPFKLDANASLTQSASGTPRPGQLRLHATGDLNLTTLDATGQAGRALGDAHLVLSPYAPIPLHALTINGRNIDPGFFDPALPAADLAFAISARIGPDSTVAGSVDIANTGPAGTIDKQRLPLRALRGRLGGSLTHLAVSDLLLDLGEAGRLTGSGSVQRGLEEKGLGVARFALHTDRLDLRHVHGRIRQTAIKGDLQLTGKDGVQAFDARLLEKNMRLDAHATLAKSVLEIREARLVAGGGSVELAGTAMLAGDKIFRIKANAAHFNPASFGDLPQADINAAVTASGALAPSWRVAAGFTVEPSRLFGQPLSGKGKLDADAKHISGLDATLALGRNTVALTGSFGLPADRLLWRVDGRQLDTLRAGLYGAVTASGALTGTMQALRTTFDVDAQGLGWTGAQRSAAGSSLHAKGEARLAGEAGKRVVEASASGTAQRFNPAAFGSPLAGSINGAFDASGRFGGGWRTAVSLTLQQSTLSNSPLSGYAKLAADNKRLANADVGLHLGPNTLALRGSFGAPADRLDFTIDAPQLAALGPDFNGVLRGSGRLAGTLDAPSIAANLDGQNLKLLGKHNVRSVHASASLGSGHGPSDPFVTDLQLTELTSGATRIAALRLQSTGTRGAHTLGLSARGDDFDATAQVAGGWRGNAWNGTLDVLQNRGAYAFALQAPVPLRIAAAPGAGVAGLARPEQIALNGAVIRLPSGSVTIESLAKSGPHWNTRGSATGVPAAYIAGFSNALRENVSGDLSLGGQWALDLRTAAATGGAPALDGMVRVFRERGDLAVGAEVPASLGLRQFEARADVVGGALRARVDLDGQQAGHVVADATAQLVQGRVADDSPLRMTASADMPSIAWLALLAGQPGLDLDGSLKLALSGAGTVGTPSLDGSVTGERLGVRWDAQGVRLQNGQLRATLAGDRLQLQRLSFEGRQGSLVAEGGMRFGLGATEAQLRLAANKLELLSRPDRTVVVTGEAKLIRDARQFTLEGKVRADRAVVEVSHPGGVTTSRDVVVLGRGQQAEAAPKQEPALPLAVDLALDLGDHFRLSGMGIDARLAGDVRLRRVDARPPRLNGTIKVVNGVYAAYGQKLAIERGVITFNGPYDNPSLSILAVRKLEEGQTPSETNVEAGVEVIGTAQAPQARLVSTPTVPDSEKLSWLVLGHGLQGTSGTETDVLATAASALLGGPSGGGFPAKLAQSIGLDELGLARASGTSGGLENTVVTVGKRLSSRTYLTFEQGAATATSVVKLRYKLNPRITLQLQTGTNNALDVLYSWAFD